MVGPAGAGATGALLLWAIPRSKVVLASFAVPFQGAFLVVFPNKVFWYMASCRLCAVRDVGDLTQNLAFWCVKKSKRITMAAD